MIRKVSSRLIRSGIFGSYEAGSFVPLGTAPKPGGCQSLILCSPCNCTLSRWMPYPVSNQIGRSEYGSVSRTGSLNLYWGCGILISQLYWLPSSTLELRLLDMVVTDSCLCQLEASSAINCHRCLLSTYKIHPALPYISPLLKFIIHSAHRAAILTVR